MVMAVPLVFLLSLGTWISIAQSITLEPDVNTVVAANSTRNVSYTCRSEKQVRLIWVVNGTQIWSDEQRKDFAAIGIWMETVTPDHDLHLVMTPDGREAQERVSIMCIAYTNEEGRIGSGETSPTHWIIFFGIPGGVEDLELVYYSESQLMLHWSRPKGQHHQISMSYNITMRNVATGEIEQSFETNDTHVLVNQRESGDCELHRFTVVGSNEAGSGPPSFVTENIPLSPNVTEIEGSQKVEGVTLFGEKEVSVSLSFKPATVCNVRFPVIHYTLDIAGVRTVLFRNASQYNDLVKVNISSLELPAIIRDHSYSLTIGACSEFTCRFSGSKLTLYTSHVVAVSAVVYERSVSVDCKLAVGSSAFCLLVFTRFSDGGTENFTTTSPDTECPELLQTRGAYLEEAQVYAVVSNRSIVQPFNVSVKDTLESPHNISCKITTMGGSSPQKEVLNEGEKAAVITVPLVVLVMLVPLLIIIFGMIWWRKGKNRAHTLSDGEGINLKIGTTDKPTITMLLNKVHSEKATSTTALRNVAVENTLSSTSGKTKEDGLQMEPIESTDGGEPQSQPLLSGPEAVASIKIPDDGDTVQLLLKPAMLAKVLLTWKSKGKRGEEILLYCKEDDKDMEKEKAKKISGPEDVEDGQAIEKHDPHEEDS